MWKASICVIGIQLMRKVFVPAIRIGKTFRMFVSKLGSLVEWLVEKIRVGIMESPIAVIQLSVRENRLDHGY